MLISLACLAATVPLVSATVERGLAWATNNAFAPTIGDRPLIKWYHHWQDGPVKEMPSKVEYVPMFWGPKKWDKWDSRKAEMNKKLPKYLLGFNEVDVSSQAGMSVDYAIQVWMQEIEPWGKKGVKLGAPAIVWDQNWLDSFLKGLAKKGGHVDFIQLHWYGSWKDLAGFKKFITSAHDRFNRDIWITEVGITSSSNPSDYNIKDFMMHAFEWLDTLGYVKRAAWFGCFQTNQPPDAYATGRNGLFNPSHGLNDRGFWYSYSLHPDRRRDTAAHDVGPEDFQSKHLHQRVDDGSFAAVPHRRHNHARIAANVMKRDGEEEGVDCDEICELRQGTIKSWEDDNSPA